MFFKTEIRKKTPATKEPSKLVLFSSFTRLKKTSMSNGKTSNISVLEIASIPRN